ncbi:MAG: hypothetical protein JXB25_03620 [Deltaproteobacteria bacterium]|nr:hypothetical protein [Deltaproteobacteria bacterium]
MAEEERYYRRKCNECGYYCVFQIIKTEDGKSHELCTHCQATEPISEAMIDCHIQQCENWMENQGRMWPSVRPKLSQLDRPGAFVDLFGTMAKAQAEKEKEAK